MNETRRKPITRRQSPSLFDKWHGIFYMPSRIDEAGHTKAFDFPVAEHWGESRNVQFHGCERQKWHFLWQQYGYHPECEIHIKLVVELELVLSKRHLTELCCNLVDFNTIMSYAGNIHRCSIRLALCQGQRSYRAKIENRRVNNLTSNFSGWLLNHEREM